MNLPAFPKWQPVAAAIFLLAGPAAAQDYRAGTDYHDLPGQVQTVSDDRIEVVEFFTYACEHCFVFEPILAAWERGLPEDVVLRRVPIAIGEPGRRYARIFYTAQSLGLLDRLHAPLFEGTQRHRLVFRSDADIRAYFITRGADAAAFDRAWNSAEVEQLINQGSLLAGLYGVDEVPSIGVNGRYRVVARESGTYQRFLRIVDALVRAEKAKVIKP